jgi:hypothetical protein
MIIKDVYNQVDSGDIDWAYLTKVYEIKDWNFQVVRPQNTFFFFFEDFESESIINYFQEGDTYLGELISNLFQFFFPFPNRYYSSLNKGGYFGFLELIFEDCTNVLDFFFNFFSVLNFFVFFGWGSAPLENIFTGFFLYHPYAFALDELLTDNLKIFVMLCHRGFDGFDEFFFYLGYFFFFISMCFNFIYRLFFNFFNFFVFFDVNFLVLFDSSFFCFFFSFLLFFFFVKSIFFVFFFNLNVIFFLFLLFFIKFFFFRNIFYFKFYVFNLDYYFFLKVFYDYKKALKKLLIFSK